MQMWSKISLGNSFTTEPGCPAWASVLRECFSLEETSRYRSKIIHWYPDVKYLTQARHLIQAHHSLTVSIYSKKKEAVKCESPF